MNDEYFGEEYQVSIKTVQDLRLALMSIPDNALVFVHRASTILHAYPDLGCISLEEEN